jgi:aryl-alcohol dehydrogenase-like predicted oxidoreductase
MFNTYIDAGGNLIDTADLYTNGVSERWVGQFIEERSFARVHPARPSPEHGDNGVESAGGLLSGKYRPSQGGDFGEGRLQTVSGSGNPAFSKFTDKNFRIVAELEKVASELSRSMAQVAINWVANRPGIATVARAQMSVRKSLQERTADEPVPGSWAALRRTAPLGERIRANSCRLLYLLR